MCEQTPTIHDANLTFTNIGESMTDDVARLAEFSAETTRRSKAVQEADAAIQASGDDFLIKVWSELSFQHKIYAILLAEGQVKTKDG